MDKASRRYFILRDVVETPFSVPLKSIADLVRLVLRINW